MKLALVGIDHTQSQIQDFESIFLTKEGKNLFYTKVVADSPVKEIVILTTCNRVEFYYAADHIKEAGQWIIETLATQKNVDLKIVKKLNILGLSLKIIRKILKIKYFALES